MMKKFKSKNDAYEWFTKEKESFFDLINVTDRNNFNFVSISCSNNEYSDLYERLGRYDKYKYCDSKRIDEIREESEVKTGLNIDDGEYGKIVKSVVKKIIVIVRSPWFVELLKIVPFVGAVVTIVDNVLAQNKVYGVAEKIKSKK